MTVKQLRKMLQFCSDGSEVELVMSLGGCDFTMLLTKGATYIAGNPPIMRLKVKPLNKRK
jgi:hypothetical protein